MSCLGRERVMSRFAQQNGTPLALIRLNYAVEMRYGVLIDIGATCCAATPVDVTMSAVNVVWQGYANEVILRALRHARPIPSCSTSPVPRRSPSASWPATSARLFGVEPVLIGTEAPTALLSNSSKCMRLFGYPDVVAARALRVDGGWLRRGCRCSTSRPAFRSATGNSDDAARAVCRKAAPSLPIRWR